MVLFDVPSAGYKNNIVDYSQTTVRHSYIKLLFIVDFVRLYEDSISKAIATFTRRAAEVTFSKPNGRKNKNLNAYYIHVVKKFFRDHRV